MLRLIGLVIFSLVLLGVFFTFHIPLSWIGTLPGDMVLPYGDFLIYIPFTTSVIFSIFFSIILYFFSRN
ncbi:MAG: DUF2905 domain-containing protein [Simkania negevensis]|nr:DUF2905 domain-containing protein [Simkania negevensis]